MAAILGWSGTCDYGSVTTPYGSWGCNIKYDDTYTGSIAYPGMINKYVHNVTKTLEGNICGYCNWGDIKATNAISTCLPCYSSDNTTYQKINLSYGTTTYGHWAVYTPMSPPPLTPSQRLREIIRSRHAPMLFLPSRKPVTRQAEEREMRARETLRRLLGEDKFRRFLRNGFVTVQAKSGKCYQIYPGHGQTVVYDKGAPVEKLCVVLRGDFTPTDSLITRYVMILHDELGFRSYANIFSAPARQARKAVQPDSRSLPQILQSLKTAA